MPESITYKALKPQIFNIRCWVKEVEPRPLKTVFNKLLKKTDFNILSFSEHNFPVEGYTAIWLLAESHLAIHTFPQHEWSYVELSGCNAHKTVDFKRSLLKTGVDVTFETDAIAAKIPEKQSENTDQKIKMNGA